MDSTVERENARLRRTVECLQDWFARASRRADALEQTRELLKTDNAELRDQFAQKDAVLAQALAEKEDATTHILYLEAELVDMERSRESMVDIADGLRNELKAVKGKRGKR